MDNITNDGTVNIISNVMTGITQNLLTNITGGNVSCVVENGYGYP